jgi:outer membrane scaffolding protein for murein synthesis (MipA/OmpV family)
MSRALLCLAALALAGCAADEGPAGPYAFVGTWDCGSTVLTFTNSTYNDGTSTYPILAVARDGRNFTLRFANGYIVALAAVTETGLTQVSSTSSNQLNCRRTG